MLTKEECYKALRYITNLYEELYITRLNESGNHIDDTKEYWILEQLINEHFDNPPLKFEELKVGMWVWDNCVKEYLQIWSVRDKCYDYISDYYYGVYRFEENRLYRKQVQEDEQI